MTVYPLVFLAFLAGFTVVAAVRQAVVRSQDGGKRRDETVPGALLGAVQTGVIATLVWGVAGVLAPLGTGAVLPIITSTFVLWKGLTFHDVTPAALRARNQKWEAEEARKQIAFDAAAKAWLEGQQKSRPEILPR